MQFQMISTVEIRGYLSFDGFWISISGLPVYGLLPVLAFFAAAVCPGLFGRLIRLAKS